MVEVLQFIFQDIWHFIGTCILLGIIIPTITISRSK